MHDQAEDRCHRIGQRDAVTAWYLLAAGTIDETMARLIERKRSDRRGGDRRSPRRRRRPGRGGRARAARGAPVPPPAPRRIGRAQRPAPHPSSAAASLAECPVERRSATAYLPPTHGRRADHHPYARRRPRPGRRAPGRPRRPERPGLPGRGRRLGRPGPGGRLRRRARRASATPSTPTAASSSSTRSLTAVLGAVYFIGSWARAGRTPGQRLLGLDVVDAAGQGRPSAAPGGAGAGWRSSRPFSLAAVLGAASPALDGAALYAVVALWYVALLVTTAAQPHPPGPARPRGRHGGGQGGARVEQPAGGPRGCSLTRGRSRRTAPSRPTSASWAPGPRASRSRAGFAGSPLRVVVLESGGFEVESATQALYDGPEGWPALLPAAGVAAALLRRHDGPLGRHLPAARAGRLRAARGRPAIGLADPPRRPRPVLPRGPAARRRRGHGLEHGALGRGQPLRALRPRRQGRDPRRAASSRRRTAAGARCTARTSSGPATCARSCTPTSPSSRPTRPAGASHARAWPRCDGKRFSVDARWFVLADGRHRERPGAAALRPPPSGRAGQPSTGSSAATSPSTRASRARCSCPS